MNVCYEDMKVTKATAPRGLRTTTGPYTPHGPRKTLYGLYGRVRRRARNTDGKHE